ncbi:unnamed protein product [Brugia timori]|uniref:Uncharacterized protein n=1 Tax=Brugia timori TaxID=42155 RepID=A0A0R3QH91_9BILA|nr:unnamed protein product [Brugia timori]
MYRTNKIIRIRLKSDWKQSGRSNIRSTTFIHLHTSEFTIPALSNSRKSDSEFFLLDITEML